MAFCHAEGFVHRDLKPKNIMLDIATNSIKIADLGLGRFVDRMNTVMNVSQKSVGGTPAYLCPEARVEDDGEQRENGAKRDVYALGVIVMEMVRRDPGGPAATHAERILQAREVMEALQAEGTEMAFLLVWIIDSCMEEDQHRRPHMTEIVRRVAEIEVELMVRRMAEMVAEEKAADAGRAVAADVDVDNWMVFTEGQLIDAKDAEGLWCEAEITAVEEGRVKIH
jgi:serine/threonine protein kinase